MNARTLAVCAVVTSLGSPLATAQTVTVSVTGLGKVTGPGIDCPSDCRESLWLSRIGVPARPGAPPRSVVLTAVGGPVQWGGACTGTARSCTLSIPAGETNVTAAFSSPAPPARKKRFRVSVVGPGLVVGPSVRCPTDCIAEGRPGLGRALDAQPDSGAIFLGWAGYCGGNSPTCTIVGDSGFVRATFGSPLNVTIPEGGRVSGGMINCPDECRWWYGPKTVVELRATADSGYSFVTWGGSCAAAGSWPTCKVSMVTAQTVTVQFARK